MLWIAVVLRSSHFSVRSYFFASDFEYEMRTILLFLSSTFLKLMWQWKLSTRQKCTHAHNTHHEIYCVWLKFQMWPSLNCCWAYERLGRMLRTRHCRSSRFDGAQTRHQTRNLFLFSFVNRIEGKHFETKWGKDLERRWKMCEVSVCLLNNFIRNHICWAVISLLFWFAHLEITLFAAIKLTTTRISVACHCHRRHRHRHRDHCFPLYNNLVVHFPFHVEQMKRKNQHDSRAFIAGDFNFYLLTISINISSNCSFIVPSTFLLRSSFFSLLCLNKKSCHHIHICHTSIFIVNDYSIQMTKKWRAKKDRTRNRINYN